MIGAAGAIFAGGAAELRHGDEGDVFRAVAEVAPEGSDAVEKSRRRLESWPLTLP